MTHALSATGTPVHAPPGERALWSGVILQQFKDLCDLNPRVRGEAESWARSGAHFRMVCALAGLEEDCVRRWLARVIALPLPERRKAAQVFDARMGNGVLTARQEGATWGKRPVERPLGSAVCAVPGCGHALDARNRIGVCGRHLHAWRYCRCSRCRS